MMQLKEIIKKRIRNNRGFTLIEAIAVLVILSIIGAVVISRGTSTAEVNLKAQAEVLKSHIRYAQFRAMNMKYAVGTCNTSFGISISANSYFMFKECNTGTKVTLPGASGDTVSLPNVTLDPVVTIIFDDWGRPSITPLGTLSTPAVNDINITLTSGSLSESITITKNTGFVQ